MLADALADGGYDNPNWPEDLDTHLVAFLNEKASVQTQSPKPKTPNPISQTPNPKTPKPKAYTPHPTPHTPDPTPPHLTPHTPHPTP